MYDCVLCIGGQQVVFLYFPAGEQDTAGTDKSIGTPLPSKGAFTLTSEGQVVYQETLDSGEQGAAINVGSALSYNLPH